MIVPEGGPLVVNDAVISVVKDKGRVPAVRGLKVHFLMASEAAARSIAGPLRRTVV